MYCQNCGREIKENDKFCPYCGAENKSQNSSYTTTTTTYTAARNDDSVSPLSRLVAFLLCLFLGGFGAHRFYAGKIGTGLLWLFTCGCFGIGSLVDLILIACGSFTDSNGKTIANWNE